MVFPQVHSLKGRAGHRTAKAAFPAAVVGIEFVAQRLFQFFHNTGRTSISRHQRPLYRKIIAIKPDQTQQCHRKADVGFRSGLFQ